MELDDLRRQWQQAPGQPPLPPAALHQMLGQQSTSLVARVRRNARAELLASVLLGLSPLLLVGSPLFKPWYMAVLLALLAVLGYYYARQLSLLRQMMQADTSIRGHLQGLVAGLRQLLRFYYRLTLWTGPLTLLLLLGYYTSHELGRAAGPRWGLLALLAGLAGVFIVAFQVGIGRFTRWYMQRLYGQHLDRLEGQLRELSEGEPAGLA